jgi:hypothetical protein
MAVYWDRRDGIDSYPYPHNLTAAWQQCPKCKAVVRVMEIGCDYYPSVERCECGAMVQCPGVEDRGRFSGLHEITRAAEGRPPVAPGEYPVNCSELVKEEFQSIGAFYEMTGPRDPWEDG